MKIDETLLKISLPETEILKVTYVHKASKQTCLECAILQWTIIDMVPRVAGGGGMRVCRKIYVARLICYLKEKLPVWVGFEPSLVEYSTG